MCSRHRRWQSRKAAAELSLRTGECRLESVARQTHLLVRAGPLAKRGRGQRDAGPKVREQWGSTPLEEHWNRRFGLPLASRVALAQERTHILEHSYEALSGRAGGHDGGSPGVLIHGLVRRCVCIFSQNLCSFGSHGTGTRIRAGKGALFSRSCRSRPSLRAPGGDLPSMLWIRCVLTSLSILRR